MNVTTTINPIPTASGIAENWRFSSDENILIYTNILTAGIALISEVMSVSKCGGDKVNGIIQSIIHCGKKLSAQSSPAESVEDMEDVI